MSQQTSKTASFLHSLDIAQPISSPSTSSDLTNSLFDYLKESNRLPKSRSSNGTQKSSNKKNNDVKDEDEEEEEEDDDDEECIIIDSDTDSDDNESENISNENRQEPIEDPDKRPSLLTRSTNDHIDTDEDVPLAKLRQKMSSVNESNSRIDITITITPSKDNNHQNEISEEVSKSKQTEIPEMIYSDDDEFESDSSEDEKTTESSKIKWCVCDRDKDGDGVKICSSCSQWYHYSCLGLPKHQIEILKRNMEEESFQCPVCKNDQNFIKKFEAKIELRKKEASNCDNNVNTFEYYEDETETESSDSDHEEARLKQNEKSSKPKSILSTNQKSDLRDKVDKLQQKTNLHKQQITHTKLLSDKEANKKIKQLETPHHKVNPIAHGTVSSIKVAHKPKILKESPSSSSLKETSKSNSVNNNQSSTGKLLTRPTPSSNINQYPEIDKKHCLNCAKALKPKGAPSKVVTDNSSVHNAQNLNNNWAHSLYCDERCVLRYIEREMLKQEDEQPPSDYLNVLDSITKTRRNSFKKLDYKTADALKKAVYELLSVQPKFYIIESKYLVNEAKKAEEIAKKAEENKKREELNIKKKEISQNIQSLTHKKIAPTVNTVKTVNNSNHTNNNPVNTANKPAIKTNIPLNRPTSTNPSTSSKSESKATTPTVVASAVPAKLPDVPLARQSSVQSKSVALNSSGADQRANVRNQLRRTFLERIEASAEFKADSINLESLVDELENGLYQQFGSENNYKKYTINFRSIQFNLKDKANNFYAKILRGQIKASEVAKLEKNEMASDSMAEERKKIQDNDIEQRVKFSDDIAQQRLKHGFSKKTHKGEIFVGSEEFVFAEPFKEKPQQDSSSKALRSSDDEELRERLPNEPPSTQISLQIPASIISDNSDTTHEHSKHTHNLSIDLNCKICMGKMSTPGPESFSSGNSVNLSEKIITSHVEVNRVERRHDSDFESDDEEVYPRAHLVTATLKPRISLIEPTFQSPVYLSEAIYIAPQSPVSELSNQEPEFSPNFDTPLQNNRISEVKPVDTNAPFWTGYLTGNDKNQIYANSVILPNTNGRQSDLVKRLKDKPLPNHLESIASHLFFRNKFFTFYTYLENIKSLCGETSLTFFRVNSMNTQDGSKMFDPSTKRYMEQKFPDNFIYSLLLQHLHDFKQVNEIKVPSEHSHSVANFYLFALSGKETNKDNKECSMMKEKFGVSISREKDTLMGVFVDYEAKKKIGPAADFGHYLKSSSANENIKRKQTIEISEDDEAKKSKVAPKTAETESTKATAKPAVASHVANIDQSPNLITHQSSSKIDERATSKSSSQADPRVNKDPRIKLTNRDPRLLKTQSVSLSPNSTPAQISPTASAADAAETAYFEDLLRQLDNCKNVLILTEIAVNFESRGSFMKSEHTAIIKEKINKTLNDLIPNTNTEPERPATPDQVVAAPPSIESPESPPNENENPFRLIFEFLSSLNEKDLKTRKSALTTLSTNMFIKNLKIAEFELLEQKFKDKFPDFIGLIKSLMNGEEDEQVKKSNEIKDSPESPSTPSPTNAEQAEITIPVEVSSTTHSKPTEPWKGESCEAFQELLKMHRDKNKLATLSFDNNEWTLGKEHFIIEDKFETEEDECVKKEAKVNSGGYSSETRNEAHASHSSYESSSYRGRSDFHVRPYNHHSGHYHHGSSKPFGSRGKHRDSIMKYQESDTIFTNRKLNQDFFSDKSEPRKRVRSRSSNRVIKQSKSDEDSKVFHRIDK